MKILTALSALQIAAILFLATRIVALERSVDGAPVTAPAAAEPSVAVPAAEVAPAIARAQPRGYPDAGEIRRIVRQELAAQLGALTTVAPEETVAAEPDPVREAELQHQLAWVDQEIDRYVGVGKISDLEMQLLQGEIAKLDKEGQRRMLGRLVRALNSGELEGRL